MVLNISEKRECQGLEPIIYLTNNIENNLSTHVSEAV
jgi:hypothetical protein